MKEISKHLLHFIKTQFGQKIKSTIKTPIFSKKSQSFLRILYRHILKASNSWNKLSHQIQESPLSTIPIGGEFAKGEAYSYIPNEIKTIIERSLKYEKTFQFKINADTYSVVMVYPVIASNKSINSKTVDRFFENALYKVYLWLCTADRFASRDCSSKMNVHLYFTDHLKILAKTKMEPLDEVHSNTAFTTSCNPTTDIHLFRSEEWFKVFIHETFHNLGLDFSAMDNMHANRRILELFPIQKEVRLYETYCETWAEIIHTLFLAFFTTQTRLVGDWSTILKKMEGFLHYEMVWSAFQCAKILNHYRLSYKQLTDLNCPRAKIARTQYKENTYVLSYYVIKAILLTQSNEFIEWVLCHNGPTMNFKKTPENIMEYCGLVSKIYQNPQWIQYISIMEEWFNNNRNTLAVEVQTLRMTLFE